MTFSAVTMLCECHPCLVLNILVTPKGNALPAMPSSQPAPLTCPSPRVSLFWTHHTSGTTRYVTFQLGSIRLAPFQGASCCSLSVLHSFFGWVIFYRVAVSYLFIHTFVMSIELGEILQQKRSVSLTVIFGKRSFLAQLHAPARPDHQGQSAAWFLTQHRFVCSVSYKSYDTVSGFVLSLLWAWVSATSFVWMTTLCFHRSLISCCVTAPQLTHLRLSW